MSCVGDGDEPVLLLEFMQPAASEPANRSTSSAVRPRDERKAPPSDDRLSRPNWSASMPSLGTLERIRCWLLTNKRLLTCLHFWDADFRSALSGCKSVNGADLT